MQQRGGGTSAARKSVSLTASSSAASSPLAARPAFSLWYSWSPAYATPLVSRTDCPPHTPLPSAARA
eukprot:2374370-Rhodomonas_salina.4